MNVQAVQFLTILCFVEVFVWECFDPWTSVRCFKDFQCLRNFKIMASNMDFNVPVDNGFAALESCTEDSEVGYGGYDGSDEKDFELVTYKRKRRDTGGTQRYVRHFESASVENKLSIIFEDLQVLKTGQREINRGMSNLKNIMPKIDQVINVTNNNVNLLKLLSYKSIDIEARSRRNNLIFRGIEEEYDENCFEVLRRFISDRLDLDANKMFLVRAHRLGVRRRGIRPFEKQKRPLIVAFRDYVDIVQILDNTRRLKDTPFSVDRDYPIVQDVKYTRHESVSGPF